MSYFFAILHEIWILNSNSKYRNKTSIYWKQVQSQLFLKQTCWTSYFVLNNQISIRQIPTVLFDLFPQLYYMSTMSTFFLFLDLLQLKIHSF